MTPHRKETNLQNEPIKFYKVVALSFLFLTLILLGVIVFMSSKRATITVITKAEPIEASVNLEVNNADKANGVLEKTEVNISKKFKPSATREQESVAMGTVTLVNDSSVNQPLIATTRLITADGILFRMRKGAVVPAKGSIDVEVYADKPGKGSEIGPSNFTIPGLSEAKQKEIYAKSTSNMIGGIKQFGVIGAEDIKEAEGEMAVELKKMAEEKLASLHPEMKAVYEVVSSTLQSDKAAGVESDEFTMTGVATVIGVFYDVNKATDLVKQELNKKVVGESEILNSEGSELAVSLVESDLVNEKAVLKLASSGLIELNPESSQIQKIIFFGKTKDEIRRYLLSLDHVSNAEIKFSPAWMHTVPHVAEHVNVVVKKVE